MTSASRSEPAAAASEPEQALLETRGLTVGFPAGDSVVLAADHVGLRIPCAGHTLGLVGESGCGKSVTLRAILGMVPLPGDVLEGEVLWRGRDLIAADEDERRRVRGREISMIFQDPGASLNPVHQVGEQIAEVFRIKLGVARREARERAVALLEEAGIAAAADRARAYPHELSGGMRQRVMIAMAVACDPGLLLADEPTTALDVTVQDQILSLLKRLQAENGMAMIFVSHDLAVIGQTCDDVAVMYAGHVVEFGTRDEVIASPRHPYTRALLDANLAFEPTADRRRLSAIGGQPPNLRELPPGCPFQTRCPHARPQCADVPMTLDRPAPAHGSACPFVEASHG